MTTVLKNDSRIAGYVWPTWIAAAFCLFGAVFGAASAANAETRSLKLYFVHTGEKAEIVFKRNGRFDSSGLRKVNMFLRDWRRNEPTKIDPRLLDVVWEAYRQSGSRAYIHVVSAYRSPATNAMLRSRSRGVAKKSQHMLGKAMDWYLPDVKLKTLRNIGLRMQAGGVGYYPTSGSPFVHFDVGNVRHWPGISRAELASVFPNGKTLHVPSDGKPLPGYEQAMAAYKQRVTNGDLAIASLASGKSSTKKRSGGLLAAWFGGGADEEEDNGESEGPVNVTPKASVPTASDDDAPAIVAPKPAVRQPEITILPPELAAPANTRPQPAEEMQPAPQEVVETPETILAALPARKVPMPAFAPRPDANVGPAADATQVAALMEDQATALPVGDAQQTAMADGPVPIPAWRPDYKAAPENDDPAALLALASATPQPAAFAPLPSERPTPTPIMETAPVADAGAAIESLPERRPGTDGSISSDTQIRVASIPEPAQKSQRVAAKGAKPVAVPVADTAGVKTTAKSGRVTTASTTKPQSKPVVVAAAPQSARWALDENYVKNGKGKSSAPSFAQNIVRTAPMEVYTAGFQSSASATDPNRFTGKAVEFLSVAKFN
ncbi:MULTISPECIES: DUF882 domain-containing protein [Mesorhizobium]|uniref:DUF882 domain-containing protein n=1 Tax=Mesorhizobium TaxID=68287 RepID=UPI001FE0ACC3|nr:MULTISPECIES: DUF882 domain-containing protein [Mesorhizobium]